MMGLESGDAGRHDQHRTPGVHRDVINDGKRLGKRVTSAGVLADNEQVIQRRRLDQPLDHRAVVRNPIPANVIGQQLCFNPFADILFAGANAFEQHCLGIDPAQRLERDIGVIGCNLKAGQMRVEGAANIERDLEPVVEGIIIIDMQENGLHRMISLSG